MAMPPSINLSCLSPLEANFVKDHAMKARKISPKDYDIRSIGSDANQEAGILADAYEDIRSIGGDSIGTAGTSLEDVLAAGGFNVNNQGSSPPSCNSGTTNGSSPGDVLPKNKSSPTSSAIASVQAALAALQAGQMSLNQLSALSTQNAFIQNQLAAVTQNNLPKSNFCLSNVSNGVSSGDLQTLQLALQQQQQNLQQQLQSFLLMQPGTAQASAVLLHA